MEADEETMDVLVNLTVSAFVTSGLPITFTTRGYNGRFGGPTIRVKQGGRLRIALTNDLGDDIDGPVNWFRRPNSTNLHLHGLHISPSGASDDVFRSVGPSTTAHYDYAIPAAHPAGLFWYHPHVHGSSSLQQGGGMAGALIIEPEKELPSALAAMDEDVLLLQHLCFYNDGRYATSSPYVNHLNVIKYSLDNMLPEPVYSNRSEVPDYILVNGEYEPTLSLRPGEFRRLRIVGAGTSAFLELHLVAAAGAATAAPPCELLVLAKDGIWVDAPYAVDAALLVPGGRLELAARCNATGAYALASARSVGHFANELSEKTVVYEGVLLTLNVEGDATVMAPPTALPARPEYMGDLMAARVPVAEHFPVVFHSLGGPYAPGLPFPQHVISTGGNPAVAFSNKSAYVRNMTVGVVQEWHVGLAGDSSVSAGNHPFHVHVNPFQVVSIDGIVARGYSVLDVRVGEWRDTIPLWLGGRVTLRFRPDRFTGRALIHCHMIPHVDLGMAAVTLLQ